MPNPRKPRGLKVLQGTDRPCRDHPEPEFPPVDQAEPPEWLSGPDAVAEWQRLVKLLTATRVLTQDNLSALGHLCNLHGACVKLYRAGMQPTAAQLSQLRLYYSDFGMTPTSRSRAGQTAKSKNSNPFSKLA